MGKKNLIDLSYYPGCSLKTTSQENNASLIYLFEHLGYNLIELEDWNCCGSSSAHSVDTDLAFDITPDVEIHCRTDTIIRLAILILLPIKPILAFFSQSFS